MAYRNVLNTVGDPVHTPNLDRLAKQSVIFNRACSTCPLSSPHRAMLMTGAFPEKNGVPGNCHVNNQNGIPDSLVCFTDVCIHTIPIFLKEEGARVISTGFSN